MSKILVLGKFLVLSPEEVRAGWGVCLEGETVLEAGPNGELKARHPEAQVLDARDRIVAPGFVNGHMHMYGVLSHGISVPVAPSGFYGFLEDFWWPYVENRLDHALVEKSARMSCAEMLRSGITTFCDVLEAPGAVPGALAVEAKVVEEVGLRAILSFEACQRVSRENGETGLRENAEFVRERRGHPLVSGMMCVHTTFTCSREFLAQAGRMAEELDCDLHMHLSESPYEPEYCRKNYGRLPVEVYEELGLLGPRVLASQGVQLETTEVQSLAAARARLVHMPLSNCEVGGGVAPVPDLLARGIPVGLGTDGYINNFFEVMRGAFLIHKAYRRDPLAMPARTVYDLATRQGARALGYRNLGELKPGFLADLITLDAATSTPINVNNLIDQLVLFRSAEHVNDVLVNGRPLMRDKMILTVDEERVRSGTHQAALELWGKQDNG